MGFGYGAAQWLMNRSCERRVTIRYALEIELRNIIENDRGKVGSAVCRNAKMCPVWHMHVLQKDGT
jgi:hypothetical protein